MHKLLLLILFPAFVFAQTKNDIPFTFREFKNLVNFFNSKEEISTFFDFKKGDVVADIGAGEGNYEGAFSLLTDSITFYVQDIDAKILHQKKLDKMIRHYSKIKGEPLSNSFKITIGTEKASNLPNAAFDKIIMISSFHEFTYMDEMIADISTKLKPNGKVYIIEAVCTRKGHVNYTSDEVIARMKKHDLRLLKIQNVEKNNGKAYEMIFSR